MAEQGTMESSFTNDNIRAERERMNDLIRQKMLAELPAAAARLVDRGIDPRPIVTTDYEGNAISVAQFYMMLRAYSVTEKAGQDPTYKAARVAIASDLPPRARDAAFVALNQQSAEEAGHGDKVFGAAYYEMGGVAPAPLAEEQLNNGGAFLEPVDDPCDQHAESTGHDGYPRRGRNTRARARLSSGARRLRAMEASVGWSADRPGEPQRQARRGPPRSDLALPVPSGRGSARCGRDRALLHADQLGTRPLPGAADGTAGVRSPHEGLVPDGRSTNRPPTAGFYLAFWTFRERGVESLLKLDIGAADLIDYFFCPVEVFLLSLERPLGWRVLNHISQITGLVGQLD